MCYVLWFLLLIVFASYSIVAHWCIWFGVHIVLLFYYILNFVDKKKLASLLQPPPASTLHQLLPPLPTTVLPWSFRPDLVFCFLGPCFRGVVHSRWPCSGDVLLHTEELIHHLFGATFFFQYQISALFGADQVWVELWSNCRFHLRHWSTVC